jgi:ABC-type Zn uptake system ZnuABC Zn-binding protein ZnuA
MPNKPVRVNRILVGFPFLLIVGFTLSLTGCGVPPQTKEGIKVVASTTLVADVVQQVGGEFIQLTTLVPTGADPHSFEPRPQDAAAIQDAQLIFLNGLELEHALEPVIHTNATGTVIEVSDGIEPLTFTKAEPGAGNDAHASGDPHVWMDPTLVKVWVQNIEIALSQADPEHELQYQLNADAYLSQLDQLDSWIETRVATIPQEQRNLVIDHESMAYFAKRYGFNIVGLVVGSISTLSSPSAQELAVLEDLIKAQNVPAIFVDRSVSTNLADQVAQDTGTHVVGLYNGSLGESSSGVTSYLEFMRFNVDAIVTALTEGK